MSIPYNNSLSRDVYNSNPNWYTAQLVSVTEPYDAKKVFVETFKEPLKRGEQCVRDGLRVVLKETIRALRTPFFRDWKRRQCLIINLKLAGYSFVHLLSVPAKFAVALTALATSGISAQRTQWLLNNMESFTSTLDGRASQLEALKEEGAVKAETSEEFEAYKKWLYSIDPKLCRQKDEIVMDVLDSGNGS